MQRTITGDISLNSEMSISVSALFNPFDYVVVNKGIFKLLVEGNKIINLSMHITPDMKKTYSAHYSIVKKNATGEIDYEKSKLVPPSFGIQEAFYLWGEDISAEPCIQGVTSLSAQAHMTKQYTVSMDKRHHLDDKIINGYFGSDITKLTKFLAQLIDLQKGSTVENTFNTPSLKFCGFGLSKNVVRITAKERELTAEEALSLEACNNTAKTKLEENEKSKHDKNQKSHRDLANEYAAELLRKNGMGRK